MIVADTNLVVYATVSSDRSDIAAEVYRRDPLWVAPPFWSVEYRSALVQNVRHERIPRGDAEASWREAVEMVSSTPVPRPPLAAFSLALDRGLSAYDAEFVALAEALGVPLVTSDRGVLRACPGVAVTPEAFVA